jgi:hypothetical protein
MVTTMEIVMLLIHFIKGRSSLLMTEERFGSLVVVTTTA